jgi:predicted NodU family carbamoyl transferase
MKKYIFIMGVDWYFFSSIKLLKNRTLVYTKSEERFLRKKNDYNFLINVIKDAFYVFYNFKLDNLITNNFVVLKK